MLLTGAVQYDVYPGSVCYKWEVETVHPEILFPYTTGVVLILGSVFVFYVYSRVRHKALLWLGVGLLAVAIESILDGYEASKLLAYAGGSWNNLAEKYLNGMLVLDAVRGFFIVIWAAMEVLFGADILAVEKRYVRVYIPAAIIVVGFIETIALNFSDITPLDKRILVSSAGRVLGILVPAALIVAFYLLKVYREIRSNSLLFFGLGFFIHGITLPTYSFAKESGSLGLGAWYTFGGVIPAILAAIGAYYLLRESEVVE